MSKRDVFNIFHQCGRLAQISLKNAYGFVQFHTVEEAEAAMQNLQGTEVKGRKIRKSPLHVYDARETLLLTYGRPGVFSRSEEGEGQGVGPFPRAEQEPRRRRSRCRSV